MHGRAFSPVGAQVPTGGLGARLALGASWARWRRVARRLAHFVGMLNQEEVVSPTGGAAVEALKDAAQRNRGSYRRLRKELEELTDHGLLMLKSLQRPEANVMQRLAVQVLCKQLDQAWTYFNRSWKMQDHVYVQYLELNTFQIRSDRI